MKGKKPELPILFHFVSLALLFTKGNEDKERINTKGQMQIFAT